LDKKAFMQAALAAQREFGKPVPIVPFADWDYYYIVEPLEWKPEPALAHAFERVVVPAGFVSDLTSTPRVFWSILPPSGAYAYPAIIHDYLYWCQPCTRAHADNVFKACMDDLRVSAVKATTIYLAVRYGGGKAWSQNRAAREQGENRILKKFPSDMRTSWAEWKNNNIDAFTGC
jgi:Protein of unknown function (DUF1353)